MSVGRDPEIFLSHHLGHLYVHVFKGYIFFPFKGKLSFFLKVDLFVDFLSYSSKSFICMIYMRKINLYLSL